MEYPNSTLPYLFPNPTPSSHSFLTYHTLPKGLTGRKNRAKTTQS